MSHRRGPSGEDRGSTGTRILIIEDHAFVRDALRSALDVPDLAIVGEARDGEEGMALAQRLQPDIVLLDLDLPGTHGSEIIRDLVHLVPDVRVIVLSATTAQKDVLVALRRGAIGYLGKDLSADALRRAIRGSRQGELVMSRVIAGPLMQKLVDLVKRPGRSDEGDGLLTEREQEVLRRVAEGLTDREIGAMLNLSPRTVEAHVSGILRKFGLRNRAEAARRYHQGE